MGALVATLDNGQLNTAVEQSKRILDRLGQSGAEAGKKLDQVGKSTGLKSVGTEAGRARTGITGLTTAVGASGRAIGRSFVAGGRGIKSFASSVAGATTGVFNLRTAAVGLAASFSFSTVIGELRGFEVTMAQVQGVTKATGTEFGQLQGLARDLGRTTQFSGQEAAEGVLFLARAGQDTNTIMQTLPPTLKLAQAGAIGLGDAANFATNIMGGFQLEASATEQSLNALATVANRSNTDITSLASAMSFVAPAAQAAGVSLEITAASIGVLGDVGIDASKAGTSLRQILIQLSNTDPPDRVVETLSKLGLTINDINPAAVGLETAFLNLRDAGLDLTDAAKLVGSEAASALLALASGSEKVAELGEEARTTTDSLDVMSAAMANTLDGAIKRAQSAFSGLIQEIGVRGTTNFLTTAFDGIASAINSLTDNLDRVLAPVNFVIDAFAELVTSARFVADVLIQAFGAEIALLFNRTALAVSDLTGGFAILEPAAKGVLVVFSALAALRVAALFLSIVNPVGLAVAAVSALVGILVSLNSDALPGVIRGVARFVDGVVGFFIGLKNAAAAVFENLADFLSEPFEAAFKQISKVIEAFTGVFKKALEVGANLVSRFTKFVGASFESVSATIGDATNADKIIPASARAKFADAADDVSEAFTRGLDFSGASDAVDTVTDALEELGDQSAASSNKANKSLVTTEGALKDLGEAGTIATTETTEGLQTTEVAIRKVGDAAVRNIPKVTDTLNEASRSADGLIQRARATVTAFQDRVGAVTGTIGQLFGELGVDVTQFVRNAEILSNRLGTTFAGAFNGLTVSLGRALGLATNRVGDFGGAVGVILDEIGIKGSDVFEALGVDADSKFAKVASAAVSVFARLTDGQLTALLDVGRNVFGGLGQLGGVFANLIPSVTSFGSSAVSAFQGLAASAATASAALAPIALVIAGIAALVVGTAAIFGAFGDRVQKIATVLAVVFAPFIFSIQLIVRLVQFLTGLFSNLGNVGSTVSKVLAVVLAPIVIPIKLIIEAVKFLIDLFGNLGGAVKNFGAIFTGIFNGILAVGRAVFAGIQAAGQALLGALQGIVGTIQNVFTGAFNAIKNVVTGVFNAILSVGRAVFSAITSAANALGGAVSSVFQGIGNVAGSIFNGILSAGRAAFNGLISAAKAAAGAINSILGGLSKGINAIGGAIANLSNSAGGVIGKIGDKLGIGKKGTVISRSIDRARGIEQEILRRRAAGQSDDQIRKEFPDSRLVGFAKGGLITGPVTLTGPDVGGKAFRTGGILSSPTLIDDASRVTPTSQLGIAGEAGEELLFPTARNSRGELAVKGIAPPNAKQGAGTVVVNKFTIDARGAGDEVIKELRAMVRETQKSVPVISAKTAALMMKGVVRV